jgi:hypothetical protein
MRKSGTFELISIARDEPAPAIIDEYERAKSVPFDLEEPVRMGEGGERQLSGMGWNSIAVCDDD